MSDVKQAMADWAAQRRDKYISASAVCRLYVRRMKGRNEPPLSVWQQVEYLKGMVAEYSEQDI